MDYNGMDNSARLNGCFPVRMAQIVGETKFNVMQSYKTMALISIECHELGDLSGLRSCGYQM
jgi:hypothetical protein